MDKVLHEMEGSGNKPNVVDQLTSNVDAEANIAFMQRFVFPYINAVLKYLVSEGYSKIMCTNNQLVILDSNNGKTLDLR